MSCFFSHEEFLVYAAYNDYSAPAFENVKRFYRAFPFFRWDPGVVKKLVYITTEVYIHIVMGYGYGYNPTKSNLPIYERSK